MLNLNKKSYNFSSRKPRSKKKLLKIVVWCIVLIVLFAALIYFPARGVLQGLKEVQANSKALSSAYVSQNFGQIQAGVNGMLSSLRKVDTSLAVLFPLRVVPVVGGYYSDSKKLAEAGVQELTAASIIINDLKPNEEELGFKGTALAGQDRISQVIKVLEKALPSLPKVAGNFKKARELVDKVNVDKYPEKFRGVELKKSLQTIKNFIVGADIAVSENKSVLEIAPQALGQPTAKNYLILFQNDKEIRPTGGFLTAYAFLKMDHGRITSTTSDDIYHLDERLLNICVNKVCPLRPPAPIAKYLPEVSGKARQTWSMRDSNLSPDVATSADEFERMYKLLGDGLTFDGIIYIDSQVVEELIQVTGPIEVFGTPYSAKIDHRCNCPNVIYELESYAEIASKGSKDRKAILGVLMEQVLAKVVGADVEKMPEFIETVVRLANHKHVMFYMHDDKTQKALSGLNWIGQVKPFSGDYLHINDANFAGGKSNLYVEQTVTQDIKVKGGSINKKLTIEYKNPQKFDTWLNGINRSYVRVYVPKGSKLISSKGSDDPVTTIEDLDKTVFEAFVVTRPQNSRKLELEFTSPYDPKGDYQILIQKQPGAKDFHYIIKVNGSTKEDFKLDSDKQFKFDI